MMFLGSPVPYVSFVNDIQVCPKEVQREYWKPPGYLD